QNQQPQALAVGFSFSSIQELIKYGNHFSYLINHHCSFSFIQAIITQAHLPNCHCVGMSAASLLAAAVMSSSPAMALVDERMSTEGTGLPFGLSNNLLGWILFGVFGLIWALYFVYTSSLEEDEESGLSL
ncbi:hypothetical protein Gogos_010764, partial [Gossypium gossypioides]|nr:hypothetical protein [Gossypium gossypioides]